MGCPRQLDRRQRPRHRHGEIAIIGDTTADRTITTPNTPTTTYGLDWTQSATSTGVNKIVLGSDMTVNGYTGYPAAGLARISNAAGSPANLVLDLNGHTLDVTQWIYAAFNNMTIISSAPGGRMYYRVISGNGPNLVIGDGVTFESPTAEGVYFGGTGMDYNPNSLQLLSAVGGYTMTYGTNGGHLGRFQVGLPSNSGLTKLTLSPYGYQVLVSNSVELFVPAGDTGQVLDLQASAMFVGGNFIDHGPVNGAGYGDGNSASYPTQRYGKIVFNNSPVTPSTVSIPRNTLTNDFFVGNPATPADTGNIVLSHDLTTTALIAVSTDSKLDVADKIAAAGTFTAAAGSKFGLTFGDTNGAIHVTGDLTLSTFSLDLTLLGGNGWVNGTDLVLFTYGGSLIGTPTLTALTVFPEFTYGGLYSGGGEVRLTNVTIPEPASLGLLALGGLMLPRRRSSRP